METLDLALRIVLAVVFVAAGVGKLLDREGSVKAVADFGIRGQAGRIIGTALPFAELAVAVALIFPATATAGAIGAIVLLLGFIAGISLALLEGRTPDCHCFGQLHSAPAGPRTLLRNAALAIMAAIVLTDGPGPSIQTWVKDRTGSELVSVGLGLLAALAIGAAVWLWRENRTLRKELENARAGLPEFGLPVGAPAPDFTLRDIERNKVTLQSLLDRGKPVALFFVGPTCGPCWLLMPHVRRWQDSLADRLTVVMVSTGTPRENEDAIAEHGIAGNFLQSGVKVMDAYRAPGTPTAVILSPDGLIASTTVVGSHAMEPLIRVVLHGSETNGSSPAVAASAAAA